MEVSMYLRWLVPLSFMSLAMASVLPGQAPSKDALIKSALSAGPKQISEHAAVMAPGADGKMMTLRPGTNGWTCLPDNPNTPGPDPMCADGEAMKWAGAWMSHAAKPGNSAPGIMYMLAGGTDASNTDPFATKPAPGADWVKTGPHWMIMWPVDPKTSGLSATPKATGTYIMFPNTPWAHLMIVQVP
jgi:hypothetical protein